MVDYAKMAATAKRLIEKNGRSCTFSRKGRSPADNAKPWNGPTTDTNAMTGAPVSYSDVKAVMEPIEIADDKANGIRTPLKSMLYVASTSFPDDVVDVTTLDAVDDGQNVWKICYLFPLNPGGVPVIYQIGLEG